MYKESVPKADKPDNGIVPLPQIPGISFEYVKGGTERPMMSAGLLALLHAMGLLLGTHVHIVHLGTVGDERHRRENPKSYHLHNPPDAIDIVKVYADGRLIDCRKWSGQNEIAEIIENLPHGRVWDHDGGKHGELHVEYTGGGD